MRQIVKLTIAGFILAVLSAPAMAISASDILGRVKAAEAGLTDYKADMFITEANKKNVSGMGEGYGDILKLEKATVAYKRPDKIRYDGYAQGIRATYIQNGYTKLVLASMIKKQENLKNAPGKRQDTLDLGFLSSRLWTDNHVSVAATEKDGTVKLKFDPKAGDNDKRHDMVWVDPKTLRVLKREKYRGGGEMRVKMNYGDFGQLTGKLPIATTSTMYDPSGRRLGTVEYRNLKINGGLTDSLFSLSAK